ncbi:choice-of-anchor M domain-containing protein [Glycomyces sp. TRM65418]|uniref:choice-of-anchor M domain-containing protein n=1 Tax=Glycomyces sp. TRM65418 TaxID=2867006 RepID=UPI001CE4FE66|nr:choice-of-anchor M domain-containing protein [Glycomyces sp. TRM65418]MCC3763113.1 choice-of-anchor M domain-containing protein [Glycomyces sp. TRM65418]QZD57121.1 choice-of-anchor M domain-containing protein [Glycomyces sp. TRM65418]
MRNLTKPAIAAAALGAAAALLFAGTAQAATTVGSGHVDVLAIAYDDTANRLDLDVAFANGSHAEPADVLFDVHSGHQVTTSSAQSCRWDAGANWVLPRTQATGKIWAGWNTDGLDRTDFGGGVQAELVSYTAPAGGHLAVYDSTTGTPRLHTDPACGAGAIAITESHHHPTWLFTEPGTYTLTMRLSGTHAVDGPVTSDQVTYTFDVG